MNADAIARAENALNRHFGHFRGLVNEPHTIGPENNIASFVTYFTDDMGRGRDTVFSQPPLTPPNGCVYRVGFSWRGFSLCRCQLAGGRVC